MPPATIVDMPDLRRKSSRPKEPKPLSEKKTGASVSLFVPYKNEVLACVELKYNANAAQARLLAGRKDGHGRLQTY